MKLFQALTAAGICIVGIITLWLMLNTNLNFETIIWVALPSTVWLLGILIAFYELKEKALKHWSVMLGTPFFLAIPALQIEFPGLVLSNPYLLVLSGLVTISMGYLDEIVWFIGSCFK